MSTIFDALKKAGQEKKHDATKPVARELEDRLYRVAGETHGNASAPAASRAFFLVGGTVVVLAAAVLLFALVAKRVQGPGQSRQAVVLQEDVQPRARPTASEPAEAEGPGQHIVEHKASEPKMPAAADLTAKPALQVTPAPTQSAQAPTIIKINLQPATPAAVPPAQESASAVAAPAKVPSLPGEQAPARQVVLNVSPQPVSPSASEPAMESESPAEVSSEPIREEGKTFGLRLEGIVWDETQPMAMINGRIVEEGDKIEGVRVVKILKTAVEIEKDGQHYSIKY